MLPGACVRHVPRWVLPWPGAQSMPKKASGVANGSMEAWEGWSKQGAGNAGCGPGLAAAAAAAAARVAVSCTRLAPGWGHGRPARPACTCSRASTTL